ncbi:MAG: UDP-2,3-diacylglucosamine diphosphatase LpxI [Candidatus Babeliales bacterium]|jgi:hypothetical protein
MIAVIAGTGYLPIQACQSLRAADRPFFVVALFPDDNHAALIKTVDGYADVVTLPFYKPSLILALLKERTTTHVFFIGKVDKAVLFKRLSLDWLAIKLLSSVIGCKSDKALMERLIGELQKHDIEVLHQSNVLSSLFVPPGVICGKLTQEIETDIALGMATAQTLANAQIGQTIVVKDGMILAVEAIEGTDACIKRGIELGITGVIICKTACANHNTRFDLPTLGPTSLTSIATGQVAAIAWSSQHTLIAEYDAFIARAKELGITLVSY